MRHTPRATSPPLWQTCKVLRPWALFRETTVYANTMLFYLCIHRYTCISAHLMCVTAPPSPLLYLPDPNSEDPNSEDPPTTDQVHNAQLVRSHFYTSLKLLFSTYWVLVVVGAFLLVILTGQPSLLKTIYLIFFFVFLITYQVCSMI